MQGKGCRGKLPIIHIIEFDSLFIFYQSNKKRDDYKSMTTYDYLIMEQEIACLIFSIKLNLLSAFCDLKAVIPGFYCFMDPCFHIQLNYSIVGIGVS